MFIGHYAVGLAAKRVTPRVSLAWLLTAPVFLDLVWPILLLAGVEHVRIAPGFTAFSPLDLYDMPWSHSLVMSLAWSAAYAGLYFLLRRDARGAAVLAGAVFSHWILDWITHKPDLALWPGGPKTGLALWDSIPGTLVVEGALFVAAIWIYVRATRPRSRAGTFALWSLLVFLAAMYIGTAFGAPPPNERAMAWLALAAWITPLWGAWIERGRA